MCLSFTDGTLSPTLIVMAFPFPHGFALNSFGRIRERLAPLAAT
jgi:hypothetical protein